MKEGSRLFIAKSDFSFLSPSDNLEKQIRGKEKTEILNEATHIGVYFGGDESGDGYNIRPTDITEFTICVRKKYFGFKRNDVPLIERCEKDAEERGNNGPVTVILV